MISSSGGGKNCFVAVAAMLVLTMLSACSSGSGDEPEPEPTATASETSSTQADEGAVSALYDKFWAARVKAENAAKADPAMFQGIAEGSIVEAFLKKVRDAADIGVTRQGRPTIDQVEVSVTGDTAEIVACLNEDSWEFFGNGEQIDSPDNGPAPVGATAERRAGSWLLTGTVVAADLQKSCG
ncbi:hypothetical protein [Aeromicrobium wangtongii]|uniref:hypothetical protein n=1 Tax=Aeromicrobium wangtongii TaxID=2969247 RepID=UPI002017F5A4|nr:hypothetical protein [Aeromicrobium wangtongii]MCL3818739.1 hypothetical protein [Aeromicrobium wangtongii]